MHEKYPPLHGQAFTPAFMDGGSARVFYTLKDLRRTDPHHYNQVVPLVGLLHLRMFVDSLHSGFLFYFTVSQGSDLDFADFVDHRLSSCFTLWLC
jgi:hypothetical protein